MSVRRRARGPAGPGAIVILLMLGAAATASAQTLTAPDRIDFDRPEAWAMKYFTSASLLAVPSVPLDIRHPLNRSGRWTAHGSVGVNLVDAVFQTNAQTFGFVDRTRLATRGVAYDAALGLRFALGRFECGGDVQYAPLTIRRPSASRSVDSLLTVRSMIMYRIH